MNRTPAVIGFLLAGAAILALGFCPGLRQAAPGGGAVPRLQITAPLDGDSVPSPISLVFRTAAALRLGATGWAADDLHLHAIVDGVEYMPAAADIAVAESSFVWLLPHLQPGARRIHLTWAARHHGNLPGPTDTLHLHVLP
ncbi:MAG: hypothetical protein WD054_02480 [Gemmatimonadota bacterium]